jgi:hypothetical protein
MHVRTVRPGRETLSARRAARPTAARQAVTRQALPTIERAVTSSSRPAVTRTVARLPRAGLQPRPDLPENFLQPNPFVDYARTLTREGGILIQYKTYDMRLRQTLWRLLAWSLWTGADAFFLWHGPHPQSWLITAGLFLLAALVNWLIVRKRVEIMASIEIRPDCMILDGSEIFWITHMPAMPSMYRGEEEGSLVLRGTYGTRRVDYLTVYRFDENDKAPELLELHIHGAMQQLWMRPG